MVARSYGDASAPTEAKNAGALCRPAAVGSTARGWPYSSSISTRTGASSTDPDSLGVTTKWAG